MIKRILLKAISLVLLFCMSLSLLPPLHVALGQEDTDIPSEFPVHMTVLPPVINGIINEANWYINEDFSAMTGGPTGKLGLLYDSTKLYIALRTNGAETVTFSAGSSVITYDLQSGSFTPAVPGAEGAKSSDGSIAEFAVTLAALGVSSRSFPFECTLTDGTLTSTWSAQLSLSGVYMFFADACDDYNDKWALSPNSTSQGIRVENSNGEYLFYNPVTTGANPAFGTGLSTLATNRFFSAGAITMEFDLTISDLQEFTLNKEWRNLLFSFTQTDMSRYAFTIGRSSVGNVEISMLDGNVNAGPVDTGIPIPAIGELPVSLHFKMAADEARNVRFYIDGIEVAYFSRLTQTQAAASTLMIVTYAETASLSPNNGGHILDARLDNLQIYRPDPLAIDSILANALISYTFDDFRGGNAQPNAVYEPLDLDYELYLPPIGQYGVLSWQSSDESILTHGGEINGTGNVTMTATLTYGGVSMSKRFTLSVLADAIAVGMREALALLSFKDFAGSNMRQDAVSQPLSLMDKLHIKEINADGQLAWSSDNEIVLTGDGVPKSVGKTVLTATLSYGSAQASKSFPITVIDPALEPVLTVYRSPTAPPMIDGSPSDAAWCFDKNIVGGGNVAALWDHQNLYLCFMFSGAQKIAVALNGIVAEYDKSIGAFTHAISGASARAGGNCLELSLPLSFFSMQPIFGQSYAVTIDVLKGQTYTTECMMVFSGIRMYIADDCNDLDVKGFVSSGSSSGESPGEYGVVVADGMYRIFNTDDVATETPSYSSLVGISTPSAMKNRYPGNAIIPGGALDVEFDIRFDDLPVIRRNEAWRGIMIRVVQDDSKQLHCALSATEDGKLQFCVSPRGGDSSFKQATSLSIGTGEFTNIRISYRPAGNTVALYIDGKLECSFTDIIYAGATGRSTVEIYASIAGVDLARSGNGVDFLIDNLKIMDASTPTCEDALRQSLSLLGFNDIRGQNMMENYIKYSLALPGKLYVNALETEAQLTWTSSDADILSEMGEPVTFGPVTLTATLSLWGFEAEKQFMLYVPQFVTGGNVGMLIGDVNPYTGQLEDWGADFPFVLDNNYASIGIAFEMQTRVNRVCLYDSDSSARISKRDLGLFASDDNITYTKITDWDLLIRDGVYTLFNFDVRTRFIKVHVYQNGAGGDYDNMLQRMMTAMYDDETLFSNGGSYAYKNQVTLQNAAGYAVYDNVIYLTVQELKIDTSKCAANMADVRFMLGDRMLHHYYDDDGGFYVRVTEAAADGFIEISVLYGNPAAQSVSDGVQTLQVEYGNITIIENMRASQFNNALAAQQMPNGVLLAVAGNSAGNAIYARRSLDGGRTWSGPELLVGPMSGVDVCQPGGFIIDGDTVIMSYFARYAALDCRYYIMRSEDGGTTWSQGEYVDLGPERGYVVSYANGIRTSFADGDGPALDYIFPAPYLLDDGMTFAVVFVHSFDGGKTWVPSEDTVSYDDTSESHEAGISESAIVETADGMFHMLSRCQSASETYVYATASSPDGISWQKTAAPSNVFAPNTMPVMERDGANVLLLWGGNNVLGGTSYLRFPLNLAYSDDNMGSFKKNLDLLFGTSLSDVLEGRPYITQPDMTRTSFGGDEAFICWNDNNFSPGIVIEDFSRKIYGSHGAFDSFEGSSLRYMGWLNVSGEQSLSGEQALEGIQSMLICAGSRVTRSFPAISKGAISFGAYIESAGSVFTADFKAAYSDSGNFFASPYAFEVDGAGRVYAIDTDSAERIDMGVQVATERWNVFSIEFDISAGYAKLAINGVPVGMLPVSASNGYNVSIMQMAYSDAGDGSGMFIDVFAAFDRHEQNLRFVKTEAHSIPEIKIDRVSIGNGQANVYFDIISANGKGYNVYLSSTGEDGPFDLYTNVNYNAKGAHIKNLKNGITYYVYITYERNGIVEMKSRIVSITPNK